MLNFLQSLICKLIILLQFCNIMLLLLNFIYKKIHHILILPKLPLHLVICFPILRNLVIFIHQFLIFTLQLLVLWFFYQQSLTHILILHADSGIELLKLCDFCLCLSSLIWRYSVIMIVYSTRKTIYSWEVKPSRERLV